MKFYAKHILKPAVISGTLLLVVGTLGLAANQPWVFPSLGPTAYLYAVVPHGRSSRLWNVLLGHFSGLATGLAAVFIVGAAGFPSVMATHHLTAGRLWTAILALSLMSQLTRY